SETVHGRLFGLAQFLIVAAGEVGVAVRDRVAVDGGESVAGLAAGQFIGNAVAHFGEGLHDLQLNDSPVRVLSITFEFLAHDASTLTSSGNVVAQIRLIEHLFDFAQAIGPSGKVFTGDGARLTPGIIAQETIEVPIARGATVTSALGSVESVTGV